MNPVELNRSVGLRLCIRRQQLGMSQEQLAVKAGMDRTAIGKIERGERGITLPTLHRLCVALETTMSALLEEL